MAKLWEGRFKGANADAVKFNSQENIELDAKLIPYDIQGSIAHVKMLGKQNILAKHEEYEIVAALEKVLERWKKGEFVLDPSLEDVHTNVEDAVTKITPHGKKMHTARSRNDQVLLDTRLYMRDEVMTLKKGIEGIKDAFAKLSKTENSKLGAGNSIMAGYTHTRVAQPITISFWCESFVQGLTRDYDRLDDCHKRINQCPLGAGALAGTGFPIDREYVAQLLEFDSVQKNELDTITSRGEMEAELLSCLTLLMVRLSGLSEEIIWLSQKSLMGISDEFCTGSSMMPNKKNPDVLEYIRGRTGRVLAQFTQIIMVKKGLMSGYHSDFQETKYALMQGIETTKECLAILAPLIASLTFNQKEIEEELEKGFAQATEIADGLVKKGISFREAHAIVGELVSECEKKGVGLSKATPLPQFSQEEWEEMISLRRERLER